MSILRPYQQQAITAIRDAISPETNRVAVEMATGLGKTITFAALIDEWLTEQNSGWDIYRALVLVHTDELVRQAVTKIKAVTRGRWSVGVVKADLDEHSEDIIVASVQTLSRPGRKERISDIGLVIVDECHHATSPTYIDILDHFGAFPRDEVAPGIACPLTPTVGFTATLARSDGQGLGVVWQTLAFSRSLSWAIRKGWLVDLKPYTITIPGIEAGSSDVALDAALTDSIAPEAVVDAWVEKSVRAESHSDQIEQCWPSTVLFAPLVHSAQAFADAFNAVGVKAEVVHGKLPAAERQAVLDRYESGVTTVVCNAMVLTEGWDSPRTGCVIVARPTRSVPLFIQMVGRGLRPWLDADAPPRDEQLCTLLCVAGTTTDLVTVADLSERAVEAVDGRTLLQMEDAFDLGNDLVPDAVLAYRGPVRVEEWDVLVQQSSKAWKFTKGGVPFLPTAKNGKGYVFVVHYADAWWVWSRATDLTGRGKVRRLGLSAPDLELALGMAEDAAQELGGDIGALLADKTRAWRRGTPSEEAVALARQVGVSDADVLRVVSSKRSGKAGRLSDLIDVVVASRVIDSAVTRIVGRTI